MGDIFTRAVTSSDIVNLNIVEETVVLEAVPADFGSVFADDTIIVPETSIEDTGTIVVPETSIEDTGTIVVPETSIEDTGTIVVPETSIEDTGPVTPSSEDTGPVTPSSEDTGPDTPSSDDQGPVTPSSDDTDSDTPSLMMQILILLPEDKEDDDEELVSMNLSVENLSNIYKSSVIINNNFDSLETINTGIYDNIISKNLPSQLIILKEIICYFKF